MRIKELRIGASHTVNLGNFNSIRVEAGLTVDVDENEEYDVVADRAQQALRRLLEQTYKAQSRRDQREGSDDRKPTSAGQRVS